jgi:hypothetical protein
MALAERPFLVLEWVKLPLNAPWEIAPSLVCASAYKKQPFAEVAEVALQRVL